MSTLFNELKERGFVESATDEKLGELLEKEKFTFYCGFDPTADSMHIGSLVPLMGLKHFQNAGHKPIVVIGGGTGMVGDPSGKSSERKLLDNETLQKNIAGMKPQFERFIDFNDSANGAILFNNLVKKGCKLSLPSVYDILPTVLYLLNLEMPDYLDGRVLTEAFYEDISYKQKPVDKDIFMGKKQGEFEFSDKDEDAVREKLKNLGYL